MILTALGATTLSIGLGVGATLASARPAPRSPNVTTQMMVSGAGMTQLMGSTGMSGGMDADDMTAMHTTMHAAMSDRISPDQLAACDSAHNGMSRGQSSSVVPGSDAGHTAHHQGAQP
jgi:hypothetical protein